jgi:uncharacterized protein (TIGR03067 family)
MGEREMTIMNPLLHFRHRLFQYAFFWPVISGAFLVAMDVDAGDADVDADLKRLQGDWIVVSVKTGDPKIDPKEIIGSWIRFDGNTLQSFDPSGKQETGKHEIVLRPKQNPKEIDILVREDRTQRGIYAFEKDRLLVSLSRSRNSPRPKDFVKDGGEDRIRIFFLERKKKT